MTDAQSRQRRRRWWVAFGLGLLIELGLVVLTAVLPRESWLFARVYSFIHYSHYPFFKFLSNFGPESLGGQILVTLLVWVVMGLIWACVLVGGRALLTFVVERLGLSKR